MAACWEEGRGDRWLFTLESLAQARDVGRERALQALRRAEAEGACVRAADGAEGEDTEKLVPLSHEESAQLVLMHAMQLLDLCSRCGAPAEVLWAALVFYRRFFAVRSPMEFDPLLLMLACVHLACKTEEVHEITLDALLEAGDFGDDERLRAKVMSLELPLLEGIGFALLVEPKPSDALRMLGEELQVPLQLMPAQRQEIVALAECFVLDLGVRSDAILRWPPSVLIAVALGAALDARGADAGAPGGPPSVQLAELLAANLEGDGPRAVFFGMVAAASLELRRLALFCEEAPPAAALAAARRCHAAVERLRELEAKRREARRQERKVKRGETKAAAASRRVPTPMRQALAELNRRVAATLTRAASEADACGGRAGSDGFGSPEEFCIRRRLDIMEDMDGDEW